MDESSYNIYYIDFCSFVQTKLNLHNLKYMNKCLFAFSFFVCVRALSFLWRLFQCLFPSIKRVLDGTFVSLIGLSVYILFISTTYFEMPSFCLHVAICLSVCNSQQLFQAEKLR